MSKKQNKRTRMLPVLLAISLLLEITACGAAQSTEPSSAVTEHPSAALSANIPSSFSDVPDGAWYAEAVEYCRQNGIMNGVSDSDFAPEDTLTRAMLATVLYRMEEALPYPGRPASRMYRLGHGTATLQHGRRRRRLSTATAAISLALTIPLRGSRLLPSCGGMRANPRPMQRWILPTPPTSLPGQKQQSAGPVPAASWMVW